ncbi:MAG: GNAT family N-acetyltransferase [Synergistaceae bacterium]|nr:GNAT family N-acetyltransferase [Synergistaceae bacterium]
MGVLRKYLIESPGSGEFFGLRAEDGNLAGTIGIIYRGGKYGGFSVNITDALIVNVFVSDKYRRRGFCSEMLREILKYLSTEKNITETRLYVHADNRPAIFAYRKTGGSEISQVKKMKVMKIPFSASRLRFVVICLIPPQTRYNGRKIPEGEKFS